MTDRDLAKLILKSALTAALVTNGTNIDKYLNLFVHIANSLVPSKEDGETIRAFIKEMKQETDAELAQATKPSTLETSEVQGNG